MLPIVIGGIFASLLYVGNKNNKLTPTWTSILFVVRFISISLIALLLLAPFIKTTKKHIQKPRLIIAIDNSRSMTYSPDSGFLADKLSFKLDELEEALDSKFEIEKLLFGQDVKPFDTLSYDEEGSDYSKLFSYLKKHYPPNDIESMILVGDGIFNRGVDPIYASSDINFPILSLVVGDTNTKVDLKINDISYNSLVYLNENIPIEVNFSAEGLKNQKLNINVFVGNDLQKSRIIQIDNNSLNKTERFDLSTKTDGKHRIRIELLLDSPEENKANNYKSIFIDVLDAKQKILILANSPHPDISALKQAISGFKNYQVDISFPESQKLILSDYNLVILHQLPSIKYSISDILNNIKRNNIAVLGIIGQQSNLNTTFQFFGETGFNSSVKSFENSMATFNQNFSIFKLKNDDISLLESLPPLKTPLGNYANANSANVMAWQEINGIRTNFPLIYFTKNEDRKNCLIMGEGLWLWRNYNFLEESNFNSFDELIGKTVQYLMARTDKRYFKIKSKGEYSSGDKVILNAELYNKSYDPINDADIEIKVTNEKGETFDYIFNSINNSYKLELNNSVSGVYKFAASTNYNNQKYTDKGEFIVVKRDYESQQLKANYNVLFKISERNNGQMFSLKNIDEIKDNLKDKDVQNRISYSQTYSGLNNIPLILIIIILLLTLEWVLRKYLGTY